MAQTKEQKSKVLEDLKDKLTKKKAIFIVDFKGLRVKDIADLRKKLRAIEAKVMIVKKTLARIAFKEQGIDLDTKKLEGEMALAFGFGDELLPAKTIYEFSRGNKNLKVLGGYIDSQKNEFLTAEQVIELAQLPSKQELLGRFVGSVASPMSGMLNALQGNLRGLVIALSSIKK